MDPIFGKWLIIVGLIIVAIGLLFTIPNKIHFFGKMPGDISYHGKKLSFYFPIVTCIILSILITIIFNHFFRR